MNSSCKKATIEPKCLKHGHLFVKMHHAFQIISAHTIRQKLEYERKERHCYRKNNNSLMILKNGAITFAHIFRKFRLRTVFICAQKCISFAHNFSVTFAHMFLHLFLNQLLVFYYIKVRQIKHQHCNTCSTIWRWKSSNRFTQSLKSQFEF